MKRGCEGSCTVLMATLLSIIEVAMIALNGAVRWFVHIVYYQMILLLDHNHDHAGIIE